MDYGANVVNIGGGEVWGLSCAGQACLTRVSHSGPVREPGQRASRSPNSGHAGSGVCA